MDIDLSQIDSEYLDKFLGKIFWRSFKGWIKKIKPESHDSKFRVTTHRYIPKDKIIRLVEGAFPDGCKISIMMGYKFTHTFDVRTTFPLRWDEFIMRVTKALEGVL